MMKKKWGKQAQGHISTATVGYLSEQFPIIKKKIASAASSLGINMHRGRMMIKKKHNFYFPPLAK